MKITDVLKGGQKIIEARIKQELRDQGHNLTGALERSLKAVINGEKLEGESLDYMITLDEGIPADQININQSLAGMTRYVEKRFGYKGGKAQKVAYLILKKQSEEGNPTKASRIFSKTGQRKKALRIGFKNAEPALDKYMGNGIDSVMDEVFNKQKSERI